MTNEPLMSSAWFIGAPMPECPGHEWVAPVTRDPDGFLHLTYPIDGLKSYEVIREQRGNLIERMIYCRFCGAKPEEA